MVKKIKSFKGTAMQRVSEVHVGGRLIRNGDPMICVHCQGDRGWQEKNGVLTHTGCGRVQ